MFFFFVFFFLSWISSSSVKCFTLQSSWWR